MNQYLEELMKYAKLYVENGASDSVIRNGHMNEFVGNNIPVAVSDVIVVDFLNFIAGQKGIDLAMYTSDLNV